MRLFIALTLPDSLRQALSSLVKCAMAVTSSRVIWVPHNHYHVTLRYLGQTSPKQFEAITAALPAIALPQKELYIEGLSVFENTEKPRILWAGIKSEKALTDLYNRVNLEVEKAGFPGSDEPFTPHITLGRPKELWNKELKQFWVENQSFSAASPFPMNMALYESVPGQQGPTYTILRQYGHDEGCHE